jgi:hypothetical protein
MPVVAAIYGYGAVKVQLSSDSDITVYECNVVGGKLTMGAGKILGKNPTLALDNNMYGVESDSGIQFSKLDPLVTIVVKVGTDPWPVPYASMPSKAKVTPGEWNRFHKQDFLV